MANRPTALLGEQRFVALTTFKRNSDGVPTPVWIAADGDSLIVLTPEESWKVKRVQHNPRVTLVPCGRTGKVSADGVPVDGTAEVISDPATVARMRDIIKVKYGIEYSATMVIERVLARRQKRRVILRIVVSPSSEA